MDLICYIVLFSTSILYISARPANHRLTVRSSTYRAVWQPRKGSGMNHDEFIATRGMGQMRFAKHKLRIQELKSILTANVGKTMPTDTDEFLDDLMLTDHQLTSALESAQTRHRRKAVRQGEGSPYYRWDVSKPIGYVFDGSHNESQIDVVLSVIAQWEILTCIRFEELEVPVTANQHYILFTNENSGSCWSYIGDVSSFISPQPVNLQASKCLGSTIGSALHEVGHALGFFHEQSRYDRDEYVTVMFDNIKESAIGNFRMETIDTMDTYDVPYDYGSDMHYSGSALAIDSSMDTLTAVDPLYQQSMGQRYGLSFYDTKLANLMYCINSCSESLPCERGGYTDPNNCNVCRCPDGFGGALCELVAPSSEVCGVTNAGVVEVVAGQQTCIEVGAHETDISCNWLVQAPTGYKLEAHFTRMNELLWGNKCLDWVEIKYKEGLRIPGPRFCGTSIPDLGSDNVLLSSDEDMMVTLRSPYQYPITRQGFQLCFDVKQV